MKKKEKKKNVLLYLYAQVVPLFSHLVKALMPVLMILTLPTLFSTTLRTSGEEK